MSMPGRAIRVTHIINGLERGGAEFVLARLVARLDRRIIDNRVISLTGPGSIGREIADTGIPVSAFSFTRGPTDALKYLRLIQAIRSGAPDIVQTWMYHSDLIGGSAARLSDSVPVIWNLRQSNFDPGKTKRSTLRIARASAHLSAHVPWAIVCGSFAARDIHARFGYDADKMLVIANGFDSEQFRPDPERGHVFRTWLGEDENSPLVGLSARYHPQKDHETFLRAAVEVARSVPSSRFVMFGDRVDETNKELLRLVSDLGLSDRVRMLGTLADPRDAYCAMDIVVSSSAFGEGLPNVLGEAMSCAVPCVSTDVGDCRWLIGSTGIIVPPSQPRALARAIADVLEADAGKRQAMGRDARQRIQKEFPLDTMVQRYELLYRRVFSQRFPRIFPTAIRQAHPCGPLDGR